MPRPFRKQQALAQCTAFLTVLTLVAAASANITIDQVAISGEVAPGVTDGATYRVFSEPVINNHGDVAFLTSLQNADGSFDPMTNNAYFAPTAGPNSSLGLLARENEPAPGVQDGSLYGHIGFNPPVLNDRGDIIFDMELRNPDGSIDFTRNQALFGSFAHSASGAELLLRKGDVLVDAVDGVAFHHFNSLNLNNRGQILIGSQLRNLDGTLNAVPDSALAGINTKESYSPFAILKTNDFAPGGDNGERVVFPTEAMLNDSGDFTFSTFYRESDAPVDLFSSEVNFLKGSLADPTSISPIIRLSDPVPEKPAETSFYGFHSVVQNRRGETAFTASLWDPPYFGSTLFGPDDNNESGFYLAAQSGTPATLADDMTNYSHISSILLNGPGDLAFLATLQPADASFEEDRNAGLFGPVQGANSPLGLILRKGDQLPPSLMGGTFVDFWEPYPVPVFFNRLGDIVFLGTVRDQGDPIEEDGKKTLFSYANGELNIVAQEEANFAVEVPGSGTEQRTIESIRLITDFAVSSTEGGLPRGLNDFGQLVFSLEFTDGSAGLFTADLHPDRIAGDLDVDGSVDGADFLDWQLDFVDPILFDDWKENFGASTGHAAQFIVPEPSSLFLLLWAACFQRRRRVRGS